MAGEDTVKLHGLRRSIYSFRAELALKTKGIPYEFVEEDLKNKSELLLKYNPIHKKVPVLVHNGKPIAESLIILEYIDETWNDNGPQLLPQDSYARAQVRFWISFLTQQLAAPVRQVIITEGEAQEKAVKEATELLKVVEDGMLESFPAAAITSENQLRALDIVACSVLGAYKAIEQVFGVKLIDPEGYPLLFPWLDSMLNLPAVKAIRPTHEETVTFFKKSRDKMKVHKA